MTVNALTVTFFATCALDWPAWPFGVRLADAIFVALAAAVLHETKAERPRLVSLDWLVILYLAGSLPSLLVTSDARASGAELLVQFYLAAVYAVTAILVQRGRSTLIIASLAVGILALATIGVVAAAINTVVPLQVPQLGETMVVPYVGEVFRVRGLTTSPAMLACALVIAVPIAILFAWSQADDGRSRLRAWWLVGLVIAAAAALLTFSHAISGLLMALAIALWPALTHWPRLRALIAASVAIVVIVANATLAASIRSFDSGVVRVNDVDEYHHTVDSGEWRAGDVVVRYEVMGYLRLKQIALETFAERPLTGAGLNTFRGQTDAAFRAGRLPSVYRASDPHSALLGRLAETGLPGGVTLVALWIGALIAALRLTRHNVWLARVALASIVALMVTSINVDIMNFRFFWVALGLVRGLHGEQQPSLLKPSRAVTAASAL